MLVHQRVYLISRSVWQLKPSFHSHPTKTTSNRRSFPPQRGGLGAGKHAGHWRRRSKATESRLFWGDLMAIWILGNVIELDDGKIYRKALYLMVKTMVSCKFSLKPIQWEWSQSSLVTILVTIIPLQPQEKTHPKQPYSWSTSIFYCW